MSPQEFNKQEKSKNAQEQNIIMKKKIQTKTLRQSFYIPYFVGTMLYREITVKLHIYIYIYVEHGVPLRLRVFGFYNVFNYYFVFIADNFF